jgi:lysozyme
VKASSDLLAFVKAWEGCVLKPYADSAGYMTVGYGHKLPVHASRDEITQAQADAYLESDIERTCVGLDLCVPAETAQREFDALVSLAFNVGVRAVRDSTLLKRLSEGDVIAAAAEFPKWAHAAGKVVDGILKRRYAEQAIFQDGDYSGRP